MIELFEQEVHTNDRQSSKGNQLKWKNAGNWYKADYAGYEGLTEYVVSHLLKRSTLRSEEYVLYEPEQIKYKETIYTGVRSADFVQKDWQIITLERLFKSFSGESLTQVIYRIREPKERLRFIVNQMERITGLKDFGIYMNKLLTIDALFLNEDRHMHNIAVLMNGEGAFRYCPIFDQGAGLLSDTSMDYPLNGDVVSYIRTVHAKSFCKDFDEQLDASEELYGRRLQFCFSRDEVRALLDKAVVYPENMRKRVEEVIFLQMKKYEYLFLNTAS